jgi:hypothetical protein
MELKFDKARPKSSLAGCHSFYELNLLYKTKRVKTNDTNSTYMMYRDRAFLVGILMNNLYSVYIHTVTS